MIKWENIVKAFGKFFLFLIEYCTKLSALVVTAVVLATNGTFGDKLLTGYSSISSALRNVFEAPGDIFETANMIYGYNTLSTTAFTEQYGTEAVSGILSYLNGGIVYFLEIYQNIIYQPFATICASMVAFSSLYLVSLILRFARQKGQGSFFNKLERKLGQRVFSTSGNIKTNSHNRARPDKLKSKSRVKSSGQRHKHRKKRSAPITSFDESLQVNQQLHEYLKFQNS